jgi:LmbE family N-acetylglucosaminyl deacetylase
MNTALVLSPHLDDAAFSCGATMAMLADAGWRVCLATAFTRRVHPAHGFALDCQLDKGLSPEVDYMALRQEEDEVAADILGVADLRWLDLPEAPHRGYASAPALFGPVREGDEIWRDLAALVTDLMDELQPDVVLGPQGLGNHVDHRQMIVAIEHAMEHDVLQGKLAFYRDTPYALRNPAALPIVTLKGLPASEVSIGPWLERKVAAACAYASQIGFQFGGATAAGAALRAFALDEGDGHAAERFLGHATERLRGMVTLGGMPQD